jgi:predicted metal-dependent phosphoesterase TrpH/predicted kinase
MYCDLGGSPVSEGRSGGFVDLHVHTNRSDGDYTPTEVVRKSEDIGLLAIAVTDHDTVAGVEDALREGAERSIEVVPGAELSVKHRDLTQVHLLGYYMDWRSEELNKILTEIRDARVGRGRRLVERINKVIATEGLDPLEFADVEKFSFGLIGRPHVAKALLERGYARDILHAFQKYLIPHNIPKYKAPFEEAVSALKDAGGIAILAHPNLITPGSRLRPEIIDELVDLGLDGLEVYYQSMGGEDEDYYRTLVRERGLILTGGSDFHGENSYGNLGFVGENRRVPYGRLMDLKARYLKRHTFMVVMSGLPGSGKSSLAERIASILDAAILSSDVIRTSHFPPGSADREFRYSAEVSSAVYRILRLEAEVNLLQGRSVVIDATCLMREGRPEFLKVAREAGTPILFVSCTATEEAIRARVVERRPGENHFSEADLEVYSRMKADLEAHPEWYARPENDPQLSGKPIIRWDSTPGSEALSIAQDPDNLAYILRFTLA